MYIIVVIGQCKHFKTNCDVCSPRKYHVKEKFYFKREKIVQKMLFSCYIRRESNYIIVSRNSGPNEDQPKSCFGSLIPSPTLFNLPAKMVEAYPVWPKEQLRRGLVAPQQSITIDPWTPGSPYSSLSHAQGGGSTLPKRPLTRSVWITW